ncbi:MAG: bifunctional 4-hydroxy-2-oxoglutarate aldolase/2-dehydro-3-deoxy-phosphogluconate aldolase [Oscillospiraceae bacterium]|nr:bifunctional 4-hydroxy-2-oxoglutarate aldolase/2-dehydro-3-deoxy-phosphogluconate aldolase [Oscillospiraceae bacterium]
MNDLLVRLARVGIVPVIAMEDAAQAVPLARALTAGDIPVAEVTFRTAAGEEAIRRIASELPEVLLGAGTVRSVEQVRRAIAAGAKYIVTPGLRADVAEYCVKNDILLLPGCVTPYEMELAMDLGITTLKFFPAEQAGGLDYIKACCAPYPELRFVPTGGIGPLHLRKYLDFPKIIACGGSWMCPKAMIDAGEFDAITRLCVEAMKVRNGER